MIETVKLKGFNLRLLPNIYISTLTKLINITFLNRIIIIKYGKK